MRSRCAGWEITPRRKNCARKCSCKRWKRSTSSASPRRSAVGCDRSRTGWRSIGPCAVVRCWRRIPRSWAIASSRALRLAHVLASEERSQVRAGLARLGKVDRQTLEAFYVQGRSLAEMSGDFSSPVGTIKRRLHVAQKRLARELSELCPLELIWVAAGPNDIVCHWQAKSASARGNVRVGAGLKCGRPAPLGVLGADRFGKNRRNSSRLGPGADSKRSSPGSFLSTWFGAQCSGNCQPCTNLKLCVCHWQAQSASARGTVRAPPLRTFIC